MFVWQKCLRVKITLENELINNKRINIKMKGGMCLNSSCKVKKR